jgi:hypothetical protein
MRSRPLWQAEVRYDGRKADLIRMRDRMRGTFLTALAGAAILASMTAGHCAAAMTPVTLGLDVGAAAVRVQPVVSVCGPRGCVPVQTKRIIHHQKPGNTVPHHI